MRQNGHAFGEGRNSCVFGEAAPTPNEERSTILNEGEPADDGTPSTAKPHDEERSTNLNEGEPADDGTPSTAKPHDILTDREILCRGPGGIDAACERLAREFGSEFITGAMLDRIEALTGEPPHPFLRRGLFCAHRELGQVLDAFEKGQKFFLYTGRGPSASMHVGHLVPFLFTAYLQRAFRVPCLIQISDDEKYLYKGLSLEQVARYTRENVRDVVACGFDRDRTFVFSNFASMGTLYPAACRVQRHLTVNQVRAVFGVGGGDSPAKMAFPAVQMAPALASTFDGTPLFSEFARAGGGRGKLRLRCVVPCGVDQDPYFRVARDVARKLGEPKPATVISKFLPALEGCHSKLSSSSGGSAGSSSSSVAAEKGATKANNKNKANSGGGGGGGGNIGAGATLLLTDTPKQVRRKMAKAVSGARGDGTAAAARRLGADLASDVPCKYLRCFFAGADAELAEIERAYAAGEMLAGEVKALAAAAVSGALERHRAARAAVTDADVAHFMRMRPLLDE